MRHDPRYAREEPDEDDREHEAPPHGAKLSKSEANYRRGECCHEAHDEDHEDQGDEE